MTREELDRELCGAEWNVGFAYGVEGTGLTASAVRLSNAMGRALTAAESLLFAEGWTAGLQDRAERLAERETDALLAAVAEMGSKSSR